MMEREQHFYAALAKFLFYHVQHGIVSVRDPIGIAEAEQYGLSPILLYGLTVAGLPIRWVTFSPLDQPRQFRDVLWDAWENAKGLRGIPDVLLVSRHLAGSEPTLVANLAEAGVRMRLADSKEKSLPASLRAAQDASRWLPKSKAVADQSLVTAVSILCQDAQHDHAFKAEIGLQERSDAKPQLLIKRWLELPERAPAKVIAKPKDWLPGGWLSSWNLSLPPSRPRYFNFDGFSGRTWLLVGEKEPYDTADEDNFEVDGDYDNAAEIAKDLIACWPNPAVEIAAYIGTTLQKLRWFVARKTTLEPHIRRGLADLLSIVFDERTRCYTMMGPYVLSASKPRALQEVYNEISGGGDACPFEIIPSAGSADSSWRYILINPCGGPVSILMVPRGDNILEQLSRLLLNFDENEHPVSREFYQDVVATCGRACRKPAENRKEARCFAERYENHWRHLLWTSE